MKKGLQKPEPVTRKDIPPFTNREVEPEEVDQFLPLPSPPSTKYEIDTKKPITKLVDKTHNVVKVIPKIDTATDNNQQPVRKIHSPILGEVFDDKNVSSGIHKTFPDIQQKITPEKIIKEDPDALIHEDKEVEKILEKILNEGNDEHASLKFTFGGENETFKNKLIELGLDGGNEAFIEFLLSEFSARIMKNDKLKIHIESGDIYFGGFNTGESLYDFLKTQQNQDKQSINYDFYYNKSYEQYFREYLNNINGEINDRLDLLTHRNTKYLFYRFNDILLNAGIDLIKIKHSEKIKDEIAIEEIEKTDWQYFINRLLEITISSEIGDDEFDNDEIETVKNYSKNLVLVRKAYDKFYDGISSVFTPLIKSLPQEEKDEINRELENSGFGRLDFMNSIEDSSFLDKFVQFYFEFGRFPGNPRLIILPRAELPDEIKNTKPIKLTHLFESYHGTLAKGLVSLQALCALLLEMAGDNADTRNVVRIAMSEYFENLTFASLNENNPTRLAEFVALQRLSVLLYKYFEVINLKSISKAQDKVLKLRAELNKYKEDNKPVVPKVVDVNEYNPPLPGPLPSNDEIKKENMKLIKNF